MAFFGEIDREFSWENGALRWSILVGKQKLMYKSLFLYRPCMHDYDVKMLNCKFYGGRI